MLNQRIDFVVLIYGHKYNVFWFWIRFVLRFNWRCFNVSQRKEQGTSEGCAVELIVTYHSDQLLSFTETMLPTLSCTVTPLDPFPSGRGLCAGHLRSRWAAHSWRFPVFWKSPNVPHDQWVWSHWWSEDPWDTDRYLIVMMTSQSYSSPVSELQKSKQW